MIRCPTKLDEVMRQSLSLALAPSDVVHAYGAYGLALMQRMHDFGYHLPLFAAVDLVCTFFTASQREFSFLPRLTLVDDTSEAFARYYHNDYQSFLSTVRDNHTFKRIGYVWNTNNDKRTSERDQILYQIAEPTLVELGTLCPFVKVVPIIAPEILTGVKWAQLKPPKREPFAAKVEFQLLAAMRLNGFLDKNDLASEGLVKQLITAKVLQWHSNAPQYVSFAQRIIDESTLKEKISLLKLSEKEHQLTTLVFRQSLIPNFAPARVNDGISLLGYANFAVAADTLEGQDRAESGLSTSGMLNELLRREHLFDHKLAELYCKYCNAYEPSGLLRQKIAELMDISQAAQERSNFFTEYSEQGRGGVPNTVYLVQGVKRFFYRASRGEFVYLDNEPPVHEQLDITLRFFLIEDMTALCENLSDKSTGCFPHHFTVHKLLSMLVIHDVVKYLGTLSNFDVHIQVYRFRESLGDFEKLDITSILKSMKMLLEQGSISKPFLISDQLFLKNLLFEGGATEVGHSDFTHEFYQRYDKWLDASSGSKSETTINLMFGRYGTFFEPTHRDFEPGETDNLAVNDHDVMRLVSDLQKPAQASELTRLLNEETSFVCETSQSRYLIASASRFAPALFDQEISTQKLPEFLDDAREFFLNTLVNESLKRIGGAIS